MAVTSTNLVLCPARLYVGASSALEPVDSKVTPNGIGNPPDPEARVDVGSINFEVDSTYTDLFVDQIIMAVRSRITELKVSVA
jgi:hypothetical protein